MSSGAASGGRVSVGVRAAVDALVYALAVTALVVGASLVVGVATGGGFVRGKLLLFLVGWLILAFATVKLWPSSPDDVDRARSDESIPSDVDVTAFQSFVQRLPPLRWMSLPPPERRLTDTVKLFLSGVLVLLASFLMETVFGVA